ncbi:hypothetical protein GH714_043408 [Hevea brasiliensis]|uniref:Amidohydrolase-related domain-containing protein n=1 Tax=Hevea brasiliensis TaxID=3981 RepID=A0A6A6K3T2_HEVBR|nr:hypothetical protein GH714_043408 [Hevea brasiliensis]
MAIGLLEPLISPAVSHYSNPSLLGVTVPITVSNKPQIKAPSTKMATSATEPNTKSNSVKTIDSHLHVWASPQEAADKYPYFPGQEPTLSGDVHFLLQNMEEAGVDGALIVQPINHMFDHSLVTRFVKDGYHAVRFNPYLWPAGQKMTNNVGKALFCKAGELGIPVGFMCFKGLNLHIAEILELCTEFPSTVVLMDHLGFCKPPSNDEESLVFSELLKLSRFPQNVVMLEQKEAASSIASQVPLSSSELEWIMGKTHATLQRVGELRQFAMKEQNTTLERIIEKNMNLFTKSCCSIQNPVALSSSSIISEVVKKDEKRGKKNYNL